MSKEPAHDEDLCSASTTAEIAALPPDAIVTTSALTRAYKVADDRGIKRLVVLGLLPPPARIGSRNFWTAGAIGKHLQKKMEEAQREADEKQRTLKRNLA